jgi:beta-lactamase class A
MEVTIMIKRIVVFCALMITILPTLAVSQFPYTELPYHLPEDAVPQLRDLQDRILQSNLETLLNENEAWQNLIANERMSVGLVDLANPYDVKFAAVNGDVMMYSASLPKIAILLAAEQNIHDGKMHADANILSDMRSMIARSSNAAATRMIDRIGYEGIAEVLMDPRYELYDENYGGGLWVGKRFAKQGRRYPDPIKGLSHAATVTQVSRFYYLLAHGKLVTRDRSKEMLSYLVDPELHHKFVNTFDRVCPEAKVYRKSGTWRQWHTDSALVWGPEWRRYILVGLVEDYNGEQILRDLVSVVEEALQRSAGFKYAQNQ